MDLNAVLPELRKPMRRASIRLPRWLARFAVARMPVPRAADVTVSEHATESGVRLRVYDPTGDRSDAGLLWIHGGGLLFGDARQDESLCLSTAGRLGLVIVSSNYRLAPEHPFPAAHDDVHAAWDWFQRHARDLGVDPARIAVGGESAGGGLAAALAQRLRDEAGTPPVAQWLFAPMLDDRTAADRSLDSLAHPVWDNAQNRTGWAGYLGHEPGLTSVPEYAAAARRDDLAGLPAAFVTWGDIELFAQEDADYARRLEAAGVPTRTDVVEGAPHGFENWAKDTVVAQELIARAQGWLADALGGVETTAP